MMTSAPLSVHHLHKRFADRAILSDISFSVGSGEIFGLIGLNGAGKTTLIKSTLDLITPDSGDITFFGSPYQDPEARRHLYYLPKHFHPSPLLKAWEFLSFSLAYYGQPLDRELTIHTAGELSLDPHVLEWTIRKYSKGMVQKLGLLSVLLAARPLLILDEPMSGLDPSSRQQLKVLMRRYREGGNTVFFSSHILSDIDELCDRIAVLHGGRLQFIGAPNEFKRLHDTGEGLTLEAAFLRAIAA